MLDSYTTSFIQPNNNSALATNSEKEKVSSREDIPLPKHNKHHNNSASKHCYTERINEELDEENYKENHLAFKRGLSQRISEKISKGLSSLNSSNGLITNKEDDESSLRLSKSRNSEFLTKLKEGKLSSRFRESNSFLDDSIIIPNRESKCQTNRMFIIDNPINSDSNLDIKHDSKNQISDPCDTTAEIKKTSTKDETIKSSYQSRNDIETIEEQHFMFVKLLHSSKRLVKHQEEEAKDISHLNSLSMCQNVFPIIQEIDLV